MCEKVTLKPEKEALEQPEQSRTKPDKNWVIGGHRNERERKEMDLSSKQAIAVKAKKWMDPSSANYPKDNHTNYKRAGWKMALKKSVKQNRQHCTRIEWKMATEKAKKRKKGGVGVDKRNTLTRRSPIKVVKHLHRVTKDRQPGERRLKQSP